MKILLIEDEKELRLTIFDFLKKEGFLVETAVDFFQGMEKLAMYQYDCVLLDMMMPGGNGMDLLKEHRKDGSDTPIIIISAKGSIEDKVEGLDFGADDYLPKPFHLAELLARVRSAIRRNNKQLNNTIEYKNVVLYPEERRVVVKGEELSLNRKEFDILSYFIIRPEKLVQKSLLAESIWGDAIDQADSLDFIYSQIKNLRKKLKDTHAEVDIHAVYGAGYKMM